MDNIKNKMGWKNWPYWLKGGMIGFFIGLVWSIFVNPLLIIIFGIFFEYIGRYNLFLDYGWILTFTYMLPCGNTGENAFGCMLTVGLAFSLFTYLVLGLIIGTIIGLIYGKIKKKKETENV